MKKKIFLMLALITVLGCIFAISVSASDTAPESYVESDTSYTVYTDSQYQEVILGVYEGTLANKTIVFGCDIMVTLEFIMQNPCDITIDLNGFTYTNNTTINKSGDFDFQNKDAIIRIKNGNISSSFCVFIFRTAGQLYAEDIDVVSRDECVYRYGNSHDAVISLKNCKMDAIGDYLAVNLNGNCGRESGSEGGSLYLIEGGEYAGLGIYCPRDGSYVKDCLVYEKRLALDTWHKHAGTKDKPQNVILNITNVTVTGGDGEIYLNDVSLEPMLYDCTFSKINLSNKTGAVIISYTSPTCTDAGTKTKYHNLTSITVDEQYSIDNPAKGHTSDLENIRDIVYQNGFHNAGAYLCPCTDCGATDTRVEAASLFACLGYSVTESGSAGIVIGFTLNGKAITEYEEITNRTVKYGVFAVSKDKLGTNDVFASDGTVAQGVINAELTNSSFTVFQIKIRGFVTDAQKNKMIAMGAYVKVTDGNGTEYSYMQPGTPLEGENYCFVSYNGITGNSSTEE